MTDWLDAIEAQSDASSPYYLPRLIAEIRRLQAAEARADAAERVSEGLAQENRVLKARLDHGLMLNVKPMGVGER